MLVLTKVHALFRFPEFSPPPGSPFLSLDPTLLLVLHLLGLLLVVTQSGLALGELDPGVGNGNPLRYSCLENPMNRGAWWAVVHGVSKTQLCMHTCTGYLQDLSSQTRNRTCALQWKCGILTTGLPGNSSNFHTGML